MTVITGHTFVTAGYGTLQTPNVGYNSGPDWDAAPLNYVSSAVSSDKTFAVAYCPASTTITCNMAAFNAKVNAYWFDPTAGSFPGTLVSGSPFTNSGSQSFTNSGQQLGRRSGLDPVLHDQHPHHNRDGCRHGQVPGRIS